VSFGFLSAILTYPAEIAIVILPVTFRPYLAVAVTGMVYVPPWVGVPVRTPVLEKVSPGGSFAVFVDQVQEVPQDAVAVQL
jgi:hypothetical protein